MYSLYSFSYSWKTSRGLFRSTWPSGNLVFARSCMGRPSQIGNIRERSSKRYGSFGDIPAKKRFSKWKSNDDSDRMSRTGSGGGAAGGGGDLLDGVYGDVSSDRSYSERPSYSERSERTAYASRSASNRSGGYSNSGGVGRSNYGERSPRGSYNENRNYHENGYEIREKKEAIYGTYDGDHLYGIAPVRIALLSKRRKFSELLVQSGMDVDNKKDGKAAAEILILAREMQLDVREFSKHDLNMLSENRPHQGFILRAETLKFKRISSLEAPIENDNPCVLVLDEVWDPQNFGALLRTSYFLGVDKVVVCAKNSSPLSAAVSKASAGAVEVMENIYSTDNLMKFLDKSSGNGWQVVGTALSDQSMPLSALPMEQPTIVVLGNEGHGIRTNILRRCTHLVKIEGINSKQSQSTSSDAGTEASMSESAGGGDVLATAHGDAGADNNQARKAMVDSLNVSVTGGIILQHLLANLRRAA